MDGRIATSGLADDVRQVVILTVGAAWSAAFEIDAHRRAAAACGVPTDVIAAIVDGQPAEALSAEGLSADAALAHRFTSRLLSEHSIDDELYGQVSAAFGDSGLVALLSLIGHYQTISSIHVTFAIPVPGDHR